ncbi:MAG: hypothetical protein A3A44_00565 [Candidatus Sungbacteria bacterium RIFCSPLOWO2_01_FULL_60_25]|uniref:Xylose isomerase-like TIM barrel domain-containing protein n=1 Tax=Candidatus Sungbacteria bacterium RIFCSPLOWO2_01_FULL_60_25 TaxID=1802281 RepID=A0A1G2LBP4_9BACT|nr:MAG: hypothetical protein A3A44_00565 [Candidatus Sungbacteria bacterium RIFCSPLOWO2_01_FULL_60_25]
MEDLETSLGFVSLLNSGRGKVGLMLVIRGGKRGLRGEAKERQYAHIAALAERHGALPMIVMVSNLPLADLDFYHAPEQSVEHVRSAIDFAAGLPGRSGTIVTFHLNTLLTPAEWRAAGASPEDRFVFFQNYFARAITPALEEVARYAAAKRIPVKVETTPVPEFGDRPRDGTLRELGNPYPLYSGRGFWELRDIGLGIALDLSHTRTLYRAASLNWGERPECHEIYKGVFPEDLERLCGKGLRDEVMALAPGDVVHLNDGRGLFDPTRSVGHEEGVPLGQGDIENLPELIRGMMTRELHVVFEINETDYAARPHLKRSIDFFESTMRGKGA